MDTIESNYRYDFKYCSCRTIGIAGGISRGNRILGNLLDMESRCMYMAIIHKKKVFLPKYLVDIELGRNANIRTE